MTINTIIPISTFLLEDLVSLAIKEDFGVGGDISTYSCFSGKVHTEAQFVARENGVVCGWPAAILVAQKIDKELQLKITKKDGESVVAGEMIGRISGSVRSILSCERIMLNFLIKLSGIATLTQKFVQKTQNTNAKITDTRKTTPGYRSLEKYAVRCGGGSNHRFSLDQAVMLKDNHIAAAGDIRSAIATVRRKVGHTIKIEVEVDRLDQVQDAIDGEADIIMLDNFEMAALSEAVKLIAGQAITEASGGVTLDRVAEIAQTGVDYISVGALTHSAPALDIGLDIAE